MSVAIVATKVDKLSKSEANVSLASITKKFNSLAVSAAAQFAQEEESCSIGSDGGSDDDVEACTGEVPVVPFSSVTGQGKSELWKVVRDNIVTATS